VRPSAIGMDPTGRFIGVVSSGWHRYISTPVGHWGLSSRARGRHKRYARAFSGIAVVNRPHSSEPVGFRSRARGIMPFVVVWNGYAQIRRSSGEMVSCVRMLATVVPATGQRTTRQGWRDASQGRRCPRLVMTRSPPAWCGGRSGMVSSGDHVGSRQVAHPEQTASRQAEFSAASRQRGGVNRCLARMKGFVDLYVSVEASFARASAMKLSNLSVARRSCRLWPDFGFMAEVFRESSENIARSLAVFPTRPIMVTRPIKARAE